MLPSQAQRKSLCFSIWFFALHQEESVSYLIVFCLALSKICCCLQFYNIFELWFRPNYDGTECLVSYSLSLDGGLTVDNWGLVPSGFSMQPALPHWWEEESSKGCAVLLALWALRGIPLPGQWVHLWALFLREETQPKPYWLPTNPHHQARVALALGSGACLHLCSRHYRYNLYHRNLYSLQWHTHCACLRSGSELCPADRYFPMLYHHLPHDCCSWYCRLLLPPHFPGPWNVLQLCCAAHQD